MLFSNPNVLMVLSRVSLRRVELGDQIKRLVRAVWTIDPLPPALARNLSAELHGHLFTRDGKPKLDVARVQIKLDAGLQRVRPKMAVDVEPHCLLEPVLFTAAIATRKDDGFQLALHAELDAADPVVREFVLARFGDGMFYHFEDQHPRLAFGEPSPASAPAEEVPADALELEDWLNTHASCRLDRTANLRDVIEQLTSHLADTEDLVVACLCGVEHRIPGRTPRVATAGFLREVFAAELAAGSPKTPAPVVAVDEVGTRRKLIRARSPQADPRTRKASDVH
jgi:hypothetical protein